MSMIEGSRTLKYAFKALLTVWYWKF